MREWRPGIHRKAEIAIIILPATRVLNNAHRHRAASGEIIGLISASSKCVNRAMKQLHVLIAGVVRAHFTSGLPTATASIAIMS